MEARAPLRWAMDFVYDQLFDGHLKELTIVDSYSKLSPAIGMGTCYRGSGVFHVLEESTEEYGVPKCIRDGDKSIIWKT